MLAHILTIGDEILIGQITDTNSSWIARRLNLAGFQVGQMKSVADHSETICRELAISLQGAGVVIITGGLGPTKDDITKKALASFLGVPLVLHEETLERLTRFFTRLGRNPATLDLPAQATVPRDCQVLPNDMGTAPGMWMQAPGGGILISLPGVPYEMEHLMEKQVIPRLLAHFPTEAILHKTLLVCGLPETTLSQYLESFEASLPAWIKLAYLPAFSQIRLRLSAIGQNMDQLREAVKDQVAKLYQILGQHIAGEDDLTLPDVVGRLLQDSGQMLALAESCTGGYLSHLITNIPGSSKYFMGAMISYANQMKESALGVQAETLKTHGAVSEETVLEMLNGILSRTGADVGLAISGIAGPDGGTPEKPVGTIWTAFGTKDRRKTFLIKAGKNREKNIQYASFVALNQLRLFLMNQ